MIRLRQPALCVVLLALAACAKEDYPKLYQTSPRAPSYTDEDIAALTYLGPTLIDNGVNFGVYSENATRIEVLLFDDPESDQPTKQFELHRFGDVWNIHIEGIGLGQHYGYVAWGPNWTYEPDWYPGSIAGFKADVDGQGNRFNPNKLLIDPYARALHRDHDWSKASIASGPKRTDVSYGAASKAVIVESRYQWSQEAQAYWQARQDENWKGHSWNDLILYEVHAKGFTASPASGVTHPGTYRGFAQKADYLKDLGITAVELMPVHEKPLDGGYWGYQTLNFFIPEREYASKREREQVIDEFKFMVDELHKRGIEVILDVVYNHTGEGGLWREKIQFDNSPDPVFDSQLYNFDPKEVAGLYSFRGLDNAAYYALSPDGQTYWNNTGVGNQTRPNHKPTRKLILDSLRYWVTEFHVDGFRFDLAPILGEKDGDYNNWDDPRNTVLQEIIDDPVLNKYNVRIIAEPWSAGGNYGMKVSQFPNSKTRPSSQGWYEWNGGFRDFMRSYINDDAWKLNHEAWNLRGDANEDMGFFFTGSFNYYDHNGRKPYHSVNFVTVHDGFTLYDLFTYNEKRNKCGPLNPVCCTAPFSPFCDRDSGESHNRSREWGDEAMKRQMMRNAFALTLLAHGTPMLLGGDEWMRTQLGNNNAYSTGADNEFNWYDWGAWEPQVERQRMRDFVRQLVRYRKERSALFAPKDYKTAAPLAWKSPQNTEPPDWNGKNLMIHYHDKTKGPEVAILFNMSNDPVTFQLPQGRQWKRVIDTQSYFDKPEGLAQLGVADPSRSGNIRLESPVAVPTSTYGVQSRTIVVLEAP